MDTATRPPLAPWHPAGVDDLVRVGRDNDGGYVVSERAIAATRLLIGLGINDDWSFEADMARRVPGLEIIGVDGSVSARIFRSRALRDFGIAARHAVSLHRWFALHALGEAQRWWKTMRDFTAFFDAPRREFIPRFIGIGPGMLRWSALRARFPAGDAPTVFVKMDIELAEYEVLPEVLNDAGRMSGIVVEFHSCGERWQSWRR